jgi:predicted AlkP superfamily pyrophosphatase or phosphodiesterase
MFDGAQKSLGTSGLWAILLSITALLLPSPASAKAKRAPARSPVTILVSIDGFRSDYLQRGASPNLSALARTGVTGPMRPSYPSLTFPNHWTLVTGRRPDRNGIVGNAMEDPRRPGEIFTMASEDPFWWNEAEPIWVSAEKQGIRTATMFWPGSNVTWGGHKANRFHSPFEGGVRPADWQQFSGYVSDEQRVNAVLDWLRRPAAIRPKLITLYFDEVDAAGHEYGPDDARTTAAVHDVDIAIGKLRAGLAALGQPANLVIVADHGMAPISADRSVAMDQLADPADYRVLETGPYASLFAIPGHEPALEAALFKPHDHVRCMKKADLPASFHYGANPRVPPYQCLADIGWTIRKTTAERPRTGGAHGYDPRAPQMTALFVAGGPAFRAGQTVAAFDNVDIYPLVARLAGVKANAGDGTIATFSRALKRR